MLGSTLGIKFTVLEFTTLRMVTITKDRGTKGASKATACTLSEMVRPNVVSGIVAILRHLYPLKRMQFFEQFRYITNTLTLKFSNFIIVVLTLLKLLQAARNTAENAIHLHRVDDKVNTAVTAASRAATAARVAAIKAVQNRIHGKFCDTNISM